MTARARRRGPTIHRGLLLLLTLGPETVFKMGGGVYVQIKQNGALWLGLKTCKAN